MTTEQTGRDAFIRKIKGIHITHGVQNYMNLHKKRELLYLRLFFIYEQTESVVNKYDCFSAINLVFLKIHIKNEILYKTGGKQL